MELETDKRIDVMLVDRKLIRSRTEAQRMILSGQVSVNGNIVVKSNQRFPEFSAICVAETQQQFVSRGGLKLAAALEAFDVDVAGATCLDIGMSTGGFADSLLQHGAARVIGIDVGHGQLSGKLRNDPRIESREGINARYLRPADFTHPMSIITVDVSFISLTLIIPVLGPLLKRSGRVVCLIKPQFEVGAGNLGKSGIVGDSELRNLARENVHACASASGLQVLATMESPITGGDGNIEFLTLLKHAESI